MGVRRRRVRTVVVWDARNEGNASPLSRGVGRPVPRRVRLDSSQQTQRMQPTGKPGRGGVSGNTAHMHPPQGLIDVLRNRVGAATPARRPNARPVSRHTSIPQPQQQVGAAAPSQGLIDLLRGGAGAVPPAHRADADSMGQYVSIPQQQAGATAPSQGLIELLRARAGNQPATT